MEIEKLLLEENVGGWDLFARSAIGSVGVILLAMGVMDLEGLWLWLYALIIFIALFSAIMRHCTPYELIGFSTKRNKTK